MICRCPRCLAEARKSAQRLRRPIESPSNANVLSPSDGSSIDDAKVRPDYGAFVSRMASTMREARRIWLWRSVPRSSFRRTGCGGCWSAGLAVLARSASGEGLLASCIGNRRLCRGRDGSPGPR